jgi:hypothetical protein
MPPAAAMVVRTGPRPFSLEECCFRITLSVPAGFLWCHTAGHEFLRSHLDMKLQLVIEILFEPLFLK